MTMYNFTHSDLDGVVFCNGLIIAFTTGKGWRPRAWFGHSAEYQALERAVNQAITGLSNDSNAGDLRRRIAENLGQ